MLGQDYSSFTDAKLEYWLGTPMATAYNLTHNISMDWGYSIGDHVGLYPIAYLERGLAKRANTVSAGARPGADDGQADIALAVQAADEYVLAWPQRWADGTISRDSGDVWPGEVNHDHSFIWGDDAFMGLTLISRLAAAGLGNDWQMAEWRAFVFEQHRLITGHLVDGDEGLYYHGFNAWDKRFSCCKWGRANGWTMMAHVEVLRGLEAGSEQFSAVLSTLAAHAAAVRKRQDPTDGRWHQLLNDTSTYLETSCTAMFTFAWATSVQNGWLPKAEYDGPIRSAWEGLASAVDMEDGTVAGICNGFGIHADAATYAKCSTSYLGSAPGLGSVLRAANAMHVYLGGA